MKSSYGTILYDPPRVAIIDLMAYADGYLVTRINTPREHRRKGIARKLLHELCSDADEQMVRLYLQIVVSGDMNERSLRRWYLKYGFREIAGHYIYVRDPGRFALPDLPFEAVDITEALLRAGAGNA